MSDANGRVNKHTPELRELCGDLEDMSVFKDTVSIMEIRSRLEYAVEETERRIKTMLAARDATESEEVQP